MEKQSLPWYRHAHVWLLIALPLTAVLASIFLILQATNSFDGLVADDYYKAGQEINKELKRDQAANALGLTAQVMLAADGKSIRVVFNSPVKGPLQLKLLHPTQAGYDHILSLQSQGGPLWFAPLDRPLESPRWKVELADAQQQWRLTGNWQPNRSETVELGMEHKAK